MRDPKRIKKFCDELSEFWEKNCPDWRFFQLIINVCRATGSNNFYLEDDKAIELIKKYFEN